MSQSIIKIRNNVDSINAYLLIAFAFILPLSVAIGNIIAGFILIFWLIKADFRNDWDKLKTNKVVLAVLAFYLLHIIGLLWTEDMKWGLHILKKETKFLLLPIFMLFVRKEHIKYYIYAFLSAVTISELLSYSIWFEIIEPFKYATVHNPTPLMSHISYNPFLAFAIYLLLNRLVFDTTLDTKQKVLYSFFVVTMSINMFITGGRAGQVMYFAMLVILLFQYFNAQKIKALLGSLLIVPIIFVVAYNSSTIFHDRANEAIANVQNFGVDKTSSVGQRLNYAQNSFEIFKDNPFIGIGTGDFKNEYKKVNEKNSPETLNTVNPHNMYVLEAVQFGILGLISLVAILFFQLKHAIKVKDLTLRTIGITLPLLFGLIMLSDSYLLGHYTSMLFIFFSAILYKDYDEKTV